MNVRSSPPQIIYITGTWSYRTMEMACSCKAVVNQNIASTSKGLTLTSYSKTQVSSTCDTNTEDSIIDNDLVSYVNPQIIDKAITEILDVENEDVVFEPKVFAPKLYGNTSLDREEEEPENNDVLQRNIYYISRITIKPFDLVIQLVQRGCLSLDAKDAILQAAGQEKFLIAVHTYITLLTTTPSGMFYNFLTSLRATDNIIVWNLLKEQKRILNQEENALKVESQPVHAHSSSATSVPKDNAICEKVMGQHKSSVTTVAPVVVAPANLEEFQEMAAALPLQNKWACKHCSYENSEINHICEICYKTKDFNPLDVKSWDEDELEDFDENQCFKCTFLNSPDVDICEVCDSELVKFDDVMQFRRETYGQGLTP